MTYKERLDAWRNDTQHNDIQRNSTQHNDTQQQIKHDP
jgi:hypothetical protein